MGWKDDIKKVAVTFYFIVYNAKKLYLIFRVCPDIIGFHQRLIIPGNI